MGEAANVPGPRCRGVGRVGGPLSSTRGRKTVPDGATVLRRSFRHVVCSLPSFTVTALGALRSLPAVETCVNRFDNW